MMNPKPYSLPVTDPYEARDVTEITFEVTHRDEAWVNLEEFRYAGNFDELYFKLSVNPEQKSLDHIANKYCHILFTGHRGTGKSTELKRFHNFVNNPKGYFSVFINLEESFEFTSFEREFFYVALIAGLAGTLKEELSGFSPKELTDLANEWLQDKEVKKEVLQKMGVEAGASVSVGADFFGYLKTKVGIKSILSTENKTSTLIREKVKKDPLGLTDKLNLILAEVRLKLEETGKGRDVMFIVDGFEKLGLSGDAYQSVFISDAHILRNINANMILTIPINAYYSTRNDNALTFPDSYILPMVDLNREGAPEAFAQIITRRINRKTFFSDPEVLETIVNHSGGSPQQLLNIVNKALSLSLGKPITQAIAKKAIFELGRRKFERLTSDQIRILEEGRNNPARFESADPPVLDMLYNLTILKYNGNRRINPIIDFYLEEKNSDRKST